MVRGLRPTDVVSYVAFRNHLSGSGNEALRRADCSRTAPSIGDFLGRALALTPRRDSWVLVERGQITGLVAAETRFGADIWDLDQLIAARFADAERVYLRLLEHVNHAATDQGIQMVFLQIVEESEALAAARQAGFIRYTTELIYQLSEVPAAPGVANAELRSRRPADHQPLFQLYTSVVPVYVRQIEGLTLQEWRWTDGWGLQSVRWRSRSGRRDFVAPSGGPPSVWLQIGARARVLALLTDSKAGDLAGEALDHGLAQLGAGAPIMCRVREYQAALGQLLEERGFQLVARHALLARTLEIRVPDRKLVPVQAS